MWRSRRIKCEMEEKTVGSCSAENAKPMEKYEVCTQKKEKNHVRHFINS